MKVDQEKSRYLLFIFLLKRVLRFKLVRLEELKWRTIMVVVVAAMVCGGCIFLSGIGDFGNSRSETTSAQMDYYYYSK